LSDSASPSTAAPGPAGGALLRPDVHKAVQEVPCDDERVARVFVAILERQANDAAGFDENAARPADDSTRCSADARARRGPTRRSGRLSACARGDHTAGPRTAIEQLELDRGGVDRQPISPPSASISRTRCPFAVPPTAGLHGMCATVSFDSVQIATSLPMRAAAHAASTPACPAPMTMISCRFI
jgi:hypothetical protein